ncbi:four helix bundle protein [Mesorhizobium sp. M0833]|uniref:four helix bundle protein n=1 Tax=Mesorhizobium sp. M0833 TaxID=2957009 RepID=UPI00333923C6
MEHARDLEVYKRAYAVSLGVHRATLAFPKMEQYALADQLRRSSKAICANLAEGFAKQTHSKPEFARFTSMAIGSCSEVETWISYAFDLEYITQATRRLVAILCPHLWNAGQSQREAEVISSSIPQFLNSSIPSFSCFGRISAYGPRSLSPLSSPRQNGCGRQPKPNFNRVS